MLILKHFFSFILLILLNICYSFFLSLYPNFWSIILATFLVANINYWFFIYLFGGEVLSTQLLGLIPFYSILLISQYVFFSYWVYLNSDYILPMFMGVGELFHNLFMMAENSNPHLVHPLYAENLNPFTEIFFEFIFQQLIFWILPTVMICVNLPTKGKFEYSKIKI